MEENERTSAVAMPLHLLKLAVGVDDIDELRRIRACARRRARRQLGLHAKPSAPRAEVLAGGSIYWVIRGHIRVRQRVTGFRSERDDKGRGYCLIEVDDGAGADADASLAAVPGLALSLGRMRRPTARSGEAPLPDRMLAELRALGLI